jgi:hypothetical protein
MVDKKMGVKIDELEEEVKTIAEKRKQVREAIGDLMKEQGVESSRTKYGTVTRGVTERYWTGDWIALHQYIADHGALELLEKRVSQTNMKEWILTHPDDFPPGLNLSREYTIKITKPRKTTGE